MVRVDRSHQLLQIRQLISFRLAIRHISNTGNSVGHLFFLLECGVVLLRWQTLGYANLDLVELSALHHAIVIKDIVYLRMQILNKITLRKAYL